MKKIVLLGVVIVAFLSLSGSCIAGQQQNMHSGGLNLLYINTMEQFMEIPTGREGKQVAKRINVITAKTTASSGVGSVDLWTLVAMLFGVAVLRRFGK